MEKSGDVFELPVSYSGEFIYEKGQECNWCCGSFDTESQAQYAAKAINYANKLAEVLACLIEESELTYSNSKTLSDAETKAKVVLAAYRGNNEQTL